MLLETGSPAEAAAHEFDLIIKGGVVIDGRGGKGYPADVGVRGGRITGLGSLHAASAPVVCDAAGKVVCPGFIDIHTHSDLTILLNPTMESSVRQGVTTEVVGNCGLSVGLSRDEPLFRLERRYASQASVADWNDLAGFFDVVEQSGLAINLLSLAGHNTIRRRVMGMESRAPTPDELASMRSLLLEALNQGAVGFSTGLEYPPGRSADVDEIVALAEVAAEAGAFYTSHLRNESDALVEAVAEALEVGRRARLPVQLSHHKAEGQKNWGRVLETLRMVDDARAAGMDVTLDQYPYTAYQTGLAIPVFPSWALGGSEMDLLNRLAGPETRATLLTHIKSLQMDWESVRIAVARRHREYQGCSIASLAREWQTSAEEAVLRVLEDEQGFVAATYSMMSEDDIKRVMRHPQTFVASDTAASSNQGPLSQDRPHPRTFGTFPRVLGHYVRDLGVIPLETAIAKMTSMPAARLGLADRGVIEKGCAADLVVFDPLTILDGATDTNPRGLPLGIDAVFVAGARVVDGAEITGRLPGVILRAPQRQSRSLGYTIPGANPAP